MFRNMVTSLFKHDRIRTTDAKAKELRRWADNMITLAKRGDLHARRQALSVMREKDVVHKLFEVAQQRYGGINGGYTRAVKLMRRPGDAAPISIVELVDAQKDTPQESTKKKAKKTTETRTTAPKTDLKTSSEPQAEDSGDDTSVDAATPEAKDQEDAAEAADVAAAPKKEDTTTVASDKEAEKDAAGPGESDK